MLAEAILGQTFEVCSTHGMTNFVIIQSEGKLKFCEKCLTDATLFIESRD